MRLRVGLVLSLCLLACQAFAGTTVTPTTTLAAETGNNTSASQSFQAQSNGNIAPGNVSKAPTRSLLYNGSNTTVLAHFMPWFGVSYHMNVGYNSADPAQVKAQVTDMLSRGISGAVIDWYGPKSTQENTTSLAMMSEAQSRNGTFQFAIMEDAGAISNCANTSGCDVTAALISDLNYINSTFIASPAYLRYNGNPVIFFFGVEGYSIDWTRVRANTPSNLMFVIQNDNGFTKSFSNAGFAWVEPEAVTASDPMALGYLADFYSTAQLNTSRTPVGASYKGFNDSLAAWGSNRLIQQSCGSTWLSTFTKANSWWSNSDQLPFFQLVTWNDYEEATEIETGIDNCVSVSASVSGGALTWSITGNESTLDHYTVFISSDGQNLMSMGDFPTGTNSLNLDSFGFASGTYQVYVKAVGKPSLLNHMSAAARYSPQGQAPNAVLTVTPNSGTAPVTVTASTAGSSDPQGSALTSSIDFGDGAVAQGTSATHTYNTAGTYTVRATVTNSLGVSAQATSSVGVTSSVPTSITIAQPANNSSVYGPIHIVASGFAPSGVDALQIYLDNQLVYQANASSFDTTVPASKGSHSVVVQLWDKLGNYYKKPLNVTVVPQLAATLGVSSGNVAVGGSVTATVTATSGSITGSSITWGDGTTSGGPGATHAYSKAGAYTVSAIASDVTGASVQSTATVNVVTSSLATTLSLSSKSIAVGQSVTAKLSATSGAIAGASINWGDGSSSSGTGVSHTYKTAGTYTVVSTATDAYGSSVKSSASLSVAAKAVVVMQTPTNGASAGRSVEVKGYATSPIGIVAMQIYIDSSLVYQNGPSTVDTYIQMPVGTHRITLQTWDTAGFTYKTAATVNVSGNALNKMTVY